MTKKIKTVTKKYKSCNIFAKIVSIILLVAVAGGIVVLGFGLYTNERKKDRAVIILPGLFASGLYDEITGQEIWDPFTDVDLFLGDLMGHTGLPFGLIIELLGSDSFKAELAHITANNSIGDGQSFLSKMGMNEDGTPMVPSIKPVPFSSESRLRYGVANAQTDMYIAMEEAYGDTHEVQVFNYDFRLDNRHSGELLEQYINEKGYKEVVLVSHSNGGEVAACYLARSKQNRDKVTLNLSLDSPYYGSFSAINIIEDINGMIEGLVESLSKNALTASLAEVISTAFDSQFKPLINMWAVYQLLPSYHLLKTQQYYYEWKEEVVSQSGQVSYKTAFTQSTFINVDGEDIFFKDATELWEFYCSRPWAKTTNGQLRTQLVQWLDYQDSMMVDTENGKVHSTSLVNSHYFSGMGYKNISKVFYKTNLDGDVVQDKDNYEFTQQGDGTVLLYSAVAGTKDSERIHIIPFTNHYDIAQRFNDFSIVPVLSVMDENMSQWDLLLNKII